MAKYRRRRRFYRSKGRWSSNIQEIPTTTVTSSGIGANAYTQVLAYNPQQTNTTTSQIYTVKNTEVTFSMDFDSTLNDGANIEDITVFVMYVPQGMNVTPQYPNQHPEYILAYRFLGSPQSDIPTSQAQPAKVKTRLARRLQTGDYLLLMIKYNDTRPNTSGVVFNHK